MEALLQGPIAARLPAKSRDASTLAALVGSASCSAAEFVRMLGDLLLSQEAWQSSSPPRQSPGSPSKAAPALREDHFRLNAALTEFVSGFFLELRRCRRFRALDLLSKTLTAPLLIWVEEEVGRWVPRGTPCALRAHLMPRLVSWGGGGESTVWLH